MRTHIIRLEQGLDGFLKGRGRPLARFVILACIIYLTFGMLATLRYWAGLVAFPGEIDYSEPIMLFESQLLATGKLYSTPGDDYFTAANHGPAYYVISAALNALAPNSYLPGRLLSLFGVACTVAAFLILVRKRGGGPLALLAAGALSLLPISVVRYGPVIKPDSLYIGITYLGLAVALMNWNSSRLLLSVPLFVLALFIKPSAIPAPAAVFIVLMQESPRRALIFAAFGVLISGVLLLLFWAALGTIFLEHLFVFNVARYFIESALFHNPAGFLFFCYPIVILGWIAHSYFRAHRVLILYAVLGIVIHVMLIGGKAGSAINYWSEPALALTLLIGLGLVGFQKGEGSPRGRILFLLGLVLVAAQSRPLWGKNRIKKEAYVNHARMRETVRALAGVRRPEVFAASPGAVVLDADLVRIPVCDTFLYNQHTLFGRNKGELVEPKIARKEFGFITINSRSPDFSDNVLPDRILPQHFDLVKKHYRLHSVVPRTPFSEGDVYFFVPRQ